MDNAFLFQSNEINSLISAMEIYNWWQCMMKQWQGGCKYNSVQQHHHHHHTQDIHAQETRASRNDNEAPRANRFSILIAIDEKTTAPWQGQAEDDSPKVYKIPWTDRLTLGKYKTTSRLEYYPTRRHHDSPATKGIPCIRFLILKFHYIQCCIFK